MTPRQSLDKRKRAFTLSLWIGFTLWFLAFIFMGESTGVWSFLYGIGAVLFVVWILLAWYQLKCPACRENLYILLMSNPWSLSVSAKIKCCPYCSVRLDAEI